jgi:hypothetical protein
MENMSTDATRNPSILPAVIAWVSCAITANTGIVSPINCRSRATEYMACTLSPARCADKPAMAVVTRLRYDDGSYGVTCSQSEYTGRFAGRGKSVATD